MHTLLNATQGIRSLQSKIDTMAQNIANVSTPGYKAKDVTFGEMLYQQIQNQPGGETAAENGRLTPEYIRRSNGVLVSGTPTLFTQGARINTDVPTDLMIEGKGFFRVATRGEDGYINTEEVAYTRNGSFKLSPEEEGVFLVTATGEYVLDYSDNPISFESGSTFNILENGLIVEQLIDGTQVDRPFFEGLVLYHFDHPQNLRSVGNGLWAYDFEDDVNVAPPINLLDTDPESFKIVQGALESSNVELNKEMTELITIQRTLQMISRSLQMSDQMLGLANDLVRR